jgi:hypothetical protein
MIRCAIVGLLALQSEGIKPRYSTAQGPRERVYAEMKLGVRIEGPDQLANYIRSMHAFLSMEKLLIRADGGRQVSAGGKVKVDHEEARVECRYDDEDHEFEYTRGTPPPDGKDKLKQMLWFLSAGGRNYTLSPEGEYKSDDANQDHNGEAMDLFSNGVTRMPDGPVREGETYEKKWKGQRSEKNKQGKFAFTQKVKVEKVEVVEGKKVATLTSTLTGILEQPASEKDKSAEEASTRAEGKTKLVIEVDTGRVVSSEGSGKVVAYHRGVNENGGKQELTLTFSVEGKLSPR